MLYETDDSVEKKIGATLARPRSTVWKKVLKILILKESSTYIRKALPCQIATKLICRVLHNIELFDFVLYSSDQNWLNLKIFICKLFGTTLKFS